MVKQRELGFVRIIKEPALTRIKNKQCPSCGKPKHEWNRRTDWECCSTECTRKFEDFYIIRDWRQLRRDVFKRDDCTCVKCGRKNRTEKGRNTIRGFIADHILAIALGGDQWDINNIQTLCEKCNKIKTKEDHGKIAKLRKKKKLLSKGQTQLNVGNST